jgi:hypothetical protein
LNNGLFFLAILQVLIKFSEKQFHVTEEEVEIVTDQSDDGEEEEEKQDDDDDVPELTTS